MAAVASRSWRQQARVAQRACWQPGAVAGGQEPPVNALDVVPVLAGQHPYHIPTRIVLTAYAAAGAAAPACLQQLFHQLLLLYTAGAADVLLRQPLLEFMWGKLL